MSGEIYLSCALCVALKSALRSNPERPPQDQKYIKYLNFEFAKEHFRTAEGAIRAAYGGVNDASKAAEQKDAYGAVQSSATDKAAENGGAAEQKARKFFTEQVAQKGHEDEPNLRTAALDRAVPKARSEGRGA